MVRVCYLHNNSQSHYILPMSNVPKTLRNPNSDGIVPVRVFPPDWKSPIMKQTSRLLYAFTSVMFNALGILLLHTVP